jgi:hypothetical protein
MDLPDLDVARQAIMFLYERVTRSIADPEEWRGLPASVEELAFVYRRASARAKSVYDEAVGVVRQL